MAKHDQIQDAELRALLGQAHQSMRSGKGTDAVRTLSDAYLYMLNHRPELMDEMIEPRPGFQMFAVMRWPMLGANLTLPSVQKKQPEIEFKRDRFAVSEAITYYEYTVESALSHGF